MIINLIKSVFISKKLLFIKNQIREDIIDVKKFQVNIKKGEI